MAIFIIALEALVLLIVLLTMDTSAGVTFTLFHNKYDVGTGVLVFATVIATSFIAWVLHLLGERQLKQRLQERQNELNEIKDRLRRAENSLAQHESKIHEFTLQVLQLARAPLPDRSSHVPQITFEEATERNALGPASSATDSQSASKAQQETI